MLILEALRSPERTLRAQLAAPMSPKEQLLRLVAPAATVRAAAVLVRSLILGAITTGVVLGLGSFILQVSTWLAVSLAVPAIARSLHVEISDRQSLTILALASIPLWLAGALYAVPEDALLFFWSRSLVVLVALYGGYIAYRGFAILIERRETRVYLTLLVGATYVGVYLVLFTLLGLLSHIVLFFVTAMTHL